jgi:hypothetical protein
MDICSFWVVLEIDWVGQNAFATLAVEGNLCKSHRLSRPPQSIRLLHLVSFLVVVKPTNDDSIHHRRCDWHLATGLAISLLHTFADYLSRLSFLNYPHQESL